MTRRRKLRRRRRRGQEILCRSQEPCRCGTHFSNNDPNKGCGAGVAVWCARAWRVGEIEMRFLHSFVSAPKSLTNALRRKLLSVVVVVAVVLAIVDDGKSLQEW